MKISLDDIEILKKYRVQTRNYYVSSSVESFTCGACVAIVKTGINMRDQVSFGISKREIKVCNRNFVCGYLGSINGGS